MKRLTLLCLVTEQERLLDVLGSLGVVHLSPLQVPEGDDLEKARAHLAHVRRALDVLPRSAGGQPSGRQAEQLIQDIWHCLQEHKALEEKLTALRSERERIEPFGSFDPASVRHLADKGIQVKLYQAPPKRVPQAPPGAVIQVLSRSSKGVYLALIGTGDVTLDAQEVRLPDKSLAGIEREIAGIESALAETNRRLEALGADREAVQQAVDRAEEQVRYLEARAGMGTSAAIAYLRGFCPEDKVESIRKAAQAHGWGLVVEDPKAGDPVPTLIRNPRWVKPIRAVFDFIGILPGYQEVDISACFLLFFSVFFAIIVGDAGYGLLFLVITFAARRMLGRVAPLLFPLLLILSTCTIVWGTLTGNYFGMTNLPAPLSGLKVEWLLDESHVMLLCFLIGAIHLTIAHSWNAIRAINSLAALAQIGWICTTWTMFFVARAMVLGYEFPRLMLTIFLIGVALITLFMTPVRLLRQEWFNHAMLPLSLVSNFVDVVSYVRLFAVGTASYAMASAFNDMALRGDLSGPLAGLIAALILFLGHALNILLAVMGVLVHGIRLNTLEFSGHLGLQWTGIKYDPFARKTMTQQTE